MNDLLRREMRLACAPADAFRAFVEHVDLWWPPGHRRTPAARLAFSGGRLVETAPDGTQWTMAEIVERDEPGHLRLAWYPGSPAAPTDVVISFDATADGTAITIVHRALTPAANEIWPVRVTKFANGWDAVLPALAHWITTHPLLHGDPS